MAKETGNEMFSGLRSAAKGIIERQVFVTVKSLIFLFPFPFEMKTCGALKASY